MEDKKRKILDKLLNSSLCVGIVSIYNNLLKKANKFKLVKDNSNFILLNPPSIIDKGYDGEIRRKHKEEIRKKLEYFLSKMEENLPKEALINMYNNIYLLDVKESLRLTLLSVIPVYLNKAVIGGYYNRKKNKVTIHSEKNYSNGFENKF